MHYTYSKTCTLTYSQMDPNLKLNLKSASEIAQDLITETFRTFRSDNLTVSRLNNAVWVIAKTQMKFFSMPSWETNVHCRSYMTSSRAVRAEMESVFTDDSDNLLFIIKQYLCPIDITTRAVRPVATINYPEDMECEPNRLEDRYRRLTYEFDETQLVTERKAYSSDIDFGRHFNNCRSICMIYDSNPVSFWDGHAIKDFEIHYLHEIHEGETVKCYKVCREDGSMEFLLKANDAECVRAYMTTY